MIRTLASVGMIVVLFPGGNSQNVCQLSSPCLTVWRRYQEAVNRCRAVSPSVHAVMRGSEPRRASARVTALMTRGFAARHRQECLLLKCGVFAGSNVVAQTLLSVPGGEAAHFYRLKPGAADDSNVQTEERRAEARRCTRSCASRATTGEFRAPGAAPSTSRDATPQSFRSSRG